MQKNAQSKRELGRGISTWLKDIPSSISGKAAEKYFNPEFKKVMTSLRKVDNNIRSIVSGESIGEEFDDDVKEKFKGDPGKYKISMKSLLKEIKSSLNRREYMKASADLGRFHAKLFEISNQINGLDHRVNDLHNQFLFGTKDNPILSEEQWEHLQDIKKRYTTARRKELLVKEAGLRDIADFFHNIRDSRARALAAWEKRYPRQTEKLKKEAYALHREGEALLEYLIATMKELASLRSTRNPDKYIEKANQLAKKFDSFDAKFKDYYNSNVKSFLEKAEAIYPTKKEPDAKEIGDKNIPVDGKTPAEKIVGPLPAVPELNITGPKPAPTPAPAPTSAVPEQLSLPGLTPGGSPPFAPPATTNEVEEPAPETNPTGAAPPDEFTKKQNHKEFYRSLEKVSKQHPNLLKSYITKYARSIQGSDPETALKLFKIAIQTKE